MSLSGSVEDLPLLELLQVVAFSQKTGYLTVETPEGDAAVVFRDGRVVSGYIWDIPPLSARAAASSPKVLQEILRRRISSTLERFIRLREGRFGFHVAANAPSHIGERDLTKETLEEGINPGELTLELARQMDEDRRDTSAVIEVSFSAPVEAEPAESEEGLEELMLDEMPAGTPVLLVDGEPEVCRLLAERLTSGGFEVTTVLDVAAARREATRLARKGQPFLVVTDVALLSLAGTHFRGGLEVVGHAAALDPRPRILLMSESIDKRLRAKARRQGASILAYKPGLSKLDPLQHAADLRAFGGKLARDLLPRLRRRAAAAATPSESAPPSTDRDAARPAGLRWALEELSREPEPDLVAFLLLRAARAYLPRALLFLVKDDRLRGLSGFGPGGANDSLDQLARGLSVPLDEASPFAEAVAQGRHWLGPPPVDGPVQRLLHQIGGPAPTSAAVIPVCAQRETIAVLYGDAEKALPDLAALVDFVERAGRVLEQAFLVRRAGANAA